MYNLFYFKVYSLAIPNWVKWHILNKCKFAINSQFFLIILFSLWIIMSVVGRFSWLAGVCVRKCKGTTSSGKATRGLQNEVSHHLGLLLCVISRAFHSKLSHQKLLEGFDYVFFFGLITNKNWESLITYIADLKFKNKYM